MASDPRIALMGTPVDVQGAFAKALTNIKSMDALEQNAIQNPLRNQLLQLNVDKGESALGQEREKQRTQSMVDFSLQVSKFLNEGDDVGALKFTESRIEQLKRSGVPTADSEEFRDLLLSNPIAAIDAANKGVEFGREKGLIGINRGQTAEQRNRQGLLDTINDPNASETAIQSAEIALGIKARAVGAAAKTVDVGGVPHVFDPVKQTLAPAVVSGKNVTSTTVGESKSEIKEAIVRGEGRGKTATNTINAGIKSIAGINKNLLNIDKAIAAIDRGARTGVIESNFLPSIQAATITLNQIQNDLALDVVGATTFGALSAGELALAKNTALPTNLNEDDLKIWLKEKGTAQRKLKDYYNEQIQFLNSGGSVPEFIAKKEAELANKERIINSQGSLSPEDQAELEALRLELGVQ